jgi:hypothetical protein
VQSLATEYLGRAGQLKLVPLKWCHFLFIGVLRMTRTEEARNNKNLHSIPNSAQAGTDTDSGESRWALQQRHKLSLITLFNFFGAARSSSNSGSL